MRYSDLRKKHGVGTVPKGTETDVKKTTKSKSSTDGNDYGSLLKKHGIDYNVDDNFVDTFIADANQFLVSAKDEYDSVGWRDATSAYESRHTARVDLDSRYFTMKGWLYSNRSNLEERVYKDFFNALNTYKAGADDILNAFRQKKEVAAKYDTEEAYNAAVEAGKEYYDTWGHYADEEDFDKYSAKGAAIPNPSYGDAQGFAIGPWRFGNDVVGNIVTFSRDNYNEIISGSEGGKYEVVGNYLYQHLTEDEANIYNYLLGKEHYDEAEAFLLDMEEKLKNREGERIGMLLSGIDIPVLEDLVLLGYGFGAGLDQWGNGVRQLFTAEKLSPTVTQYASAEITDSLDGFGKHAYSAATTVGNMAPSILATYLSAGLGASATVTQAAGAFTMGASAAGNAYASALNDGYSKEQAKAYGFLVGASEGVLQYLLGGIGELGGVSTSKIMSKVATIDKSLLRIGAKLGVGIGSEIVEEEVQNFLEPAFRTIIFGEEYDAPTIDEMIETAIVTAMSTFAMEGPSTVSHDIKNSRYYSNAYGDVQQELVAQSIDLPEGSLSNGLGQKYQRRLDSGKNLNGHQLGRLVEANEQQFRIEDITKIQSAVEARLTKLGATGDVRAIAAVLAKQAAGENLSHAEKRLIAKSKPGQQVASELDPANIRAGTTDSAWVQNIGTERVNVAEYNSDPVNTVANQGTQTEQQRLLRHEELSQNLRILEEQVREIENEVEIKNSRGVKKGWMTADIERASVLNRLIDITDNELKRIENTKASQSSAKLQLSESGESVESNREKVLAIFRRIDRIKREGNIITDGSHLQNGKLQTNATYQTGEHEYIYQTNSDGLIWKVYVEELKEKVHDDRLPHDRKTVGKLPGDHAGHLIGDQYGGSPKIDNLVSQAALVNLSTYKKIENQWKKAKADGKKVTIEITVNYDTGGVRPSSFTVEYVIDGKYIQKDIPNKSRGNADGKSV